MKKNNELTEVLDVLSNVAYMWKEAALDLNLAYVSFSYWVLRYWDLVEDDIINYRETIDDEGWEHLQVLAQQFQKVDQQRRPKTKPADEPNQGDEKSKRAERQKRFLEEEAKLDDQGIVS